jgi:hypothetical protein
MDTLLELVARDSELIAELLVNPSNTAAARAAVAAGRAGRTVVLALAELDGTLDETGERGGWWWLDGLRRAGRANFYTREQVIAGMAAKIDPDHIGRLSVSELDGVAKIDERWRDAADAWIQSLLHDAYAGQVARALERSHKTQVSKVRID